MPGNLLALLNDTDDATVAEEIAINRLLLRRLLAAVDEDDALQARDLMRIARLVFSGGKTVARLLREERALSGETADSVAAAIGEALDELALEWGLEL